MFPPGECEVWREAMGYYRGEDWKTRVHAQPADRAPAPAETRRLMSSRSVASSGWFSKRHTRARCFHKRLDMLIRRDQKLEACVAILAGICNAARRCWPAHVDSACWTERSRRHRVWAWIYQVRNCDLLRRPVLSKLIRPIPSRKVGQVAQCRGLLPG